MSIPLDYKKYPQTLKIYLVYFFTFLQNHRKKKGKMVNNK